MSAANAHDPWWASFVASILGAFLVYLRYRKGEGEKTLADRQGGFEDRLLEDGTALRTECRQLRAELLESAKREAELKAKADVNEKLMAAQEAEMDLLRAMVRKGAGTIDLLIDDKVDPLKDPEQPPG